MKTTSEHETRSLAVRSWLGDFDHWFGGLEFFHRLADDELVAGLLTGTGAQGSGYRPPEVARRVLAELYGQPPQPERFPDQFFPLIPALVDRAPLPGAPAELLPELIRRIGLVVDALNQRGASMTPHGVLVHATGREVTLDRRGSSRVYLLRGDQPRVLLADDSLAQGVLAHGETPEPWMRSVMTTWFGKSEPGTVAPPVTLTLSPGDRLLVMPHLVYDACDETKLLEGVHDPQAFAQSLPAHCPRGWMLLAIDAKR
jgi:hypothetical protein